MPDESEEKKRLWEVDPHLYEKGARAGFLERWVLPRLKVLGKFILIALALTYPIYLVYVGLAYGGIAFWSFLGGSFAVIGVILWKLGFASHYSNWDIGFRGLLGVIAGGMLAIGFYIGLIYAKTLLLPIAFALLGVGLFFVLRRARF
jgi:hypothetical protein